MHKISGVHIAGHCREEKVQEINNLRVQRGCVCMQHTEAELHVLMQYRKCNALGAEHEARELPFLSCRLAHACSLDNCMMAMRVALVDRAPGIAPCSSCSLCEMEEKESNSQVHFI